MRGKVGTRGRGTPTLLGEFFIFYVRQHTVKHTANPFHTKIILYMAEDLAKLTVSALKQRLKAASVAGTGEKPDLIARLKQVASGEAVKVDGVNPAALKAGVLKKELATRGLPCSLDLESRDVLVGRLIDALKQPRRMVSTAPPTLCYKSLLPLCVPSLNACHGHARDEMPFCWESDFEQRYYYYY